MRKLSSLRRFFVVFICVKLLLELILVGVKGDAFEELQAYGMGTLRVSAGMIAVIVTASNLVLALLGIWLFHHLLRQKNWARLLFLTAGWLAVVDACSGLLFQYRSLKILHDITPAVDWNSVLLVDRLSDIPGLIYFGYLIFVLQFDQDVRGLFLSPRAEDPANPH